MNNAYVITIFYTHRNFFYKITSFPLLSYFSEIILRLMYNEENNIPGHNMFAFNFDLTKEK